MSDAPKSAKLFSFVEFCLWNAYDEPDQLPAQPVHSARSRWRAARSITPPSIESAATTTPSTVSTRRFTGSIPIGRPSSGSAATGPPPRRCSGGSAGTRWRAAGRRSAPIRSTSRWDPESSGTWCSSWATSRTTPKTSGNHRRRQQDEGKRPPQSVLDLRCSRCRTRRPADVLDRPAVDVLRVDR